jgi:hypothetical protein
VGMPAGEAVGQRRDGERRGAMDPKIVPATISATIMAAVRPTTSQVRRSCRSWSSPRKTWSCCHWCRV